MLTEDRAVWSTAYINNLPDSAFLYIESGGEKDSEGKTTPRSLRHFPYKDSSGNVDLIHLRNALSRIPQSDLPASVKASVEQKARNILANSNRGLDSELERRSVQISQVEFREQSDKMIFEGRAAVFNEWADLGSFKEEVKRGAFRKAINRGVDTVFALNHNYDLTMARTSVSDGPGMLVLSESHKGLETYAELAPTSAARDLKVLVDTGVIRQMSFAWPRGTVTDSWNEDYTERSISEFGDLIDVSPVVHPAYTGTQATMRDLASALTDKIHRAVTGEDERRLVALLEQVLSDRAEELVIRADSQEPDDVADATVAETEEDGVVGQRYRLAARKRRLQLIALNNARS